MELTQTELLILGRLTGDSELVELLQRIDGDKERQLLDQMRVESQSSAIDPNLIIQLGAKASERKVGCKLYLEAARSVMRRQQLQEV